MSTEQIIDLVVVIVYILGITVLGIWVGRHSSKNPESYFLGGRSFNWVLVGFSLFATNISMGFFVAWTEKAARAGFAAFNPELLGGVMLTISAVVFIPLYLKNRIYTIPQFLELRYNRTAKLLFGGIFVAKNVLASPVGLFTASLGILGLFGWEPSAQNIWICAFCIIFTVGLYAVFGGLTSVVITDFAQVVIMIFGGLMVCVVGLVKIGGFGPILEGLPDHFELLRPASDNEFPWTAVMSGQLLHSAFYAFSEIAILQRALGAKDVNNAKCGLLLGAYLKLFGVVLFVIPGFIGILLYSDSATTGTLYTTMVRDFLPVGLSGLVLAGMIAAMMSSQDSGINAMSSVVAMDIYPVFRKNASPKESVIVGKVMAACNLIWGAIAAPLFLGMDRAIFDLIMTVAGFMVIPAGTCFLFGRFNKRVNGAGAVATLFTGLVVGVYYIVCKNFPAMNQFLPDAIREWHFYHVFPVVFLLLTTILFVVSYATQAPPQEKLDCLQPADAVKLEEGPKPPLFKSFNFWWAVYICIVLGFYFML